MRRFVLLAVIPLVLGLGWSTAPAADSAGTQLGDPAPGDCAKYRLAPDGSNRQSFDASEAVGGIAALPPRIATQLTPSQSAMYCIGFQNRGSNPIDLKVDAVDLAADAQGLPSSQRDAEDRGASRWVKLPTTKVRDLAPGDVAWLQVQVHVPDDALAGSSYASILATDATPPEKQATGSKVQSVPSVASQLFFDIPGDATRKGEVTSIRSPHVIWWDGFGWGDLPGLKKLRRLGVATVHFSWKNTGDYTSDIGGQVNITSDLSDKSVTKLDVPEQVVLRGSERTFAITWQRDIPIVGKFTPVLEVRGDSGRVEKHKLHSIWVIPSWWYLLALLLAIVLPTWWRRRSRRRYEELLARVEAAEARGDEGEWDDAGDGWEAPR